MTDFFDKPFDDGTSFKLNIFEGYLREWLPVFIAPKKKIFKNIRIFDFFAGYGMDKNGKKGSPLIIRDEVTNSINSWKPSDIFLNVILNEYTKKGYDQLIKNFGEPDVFEFSIENLDFQVIFDKYYPEMVDTQDDSANLLFLDQCGIKHVTPKTFKKIINLKATDFLFFISSSYLHRFYEIEEFRKYVNIPEETFSTNPYKNIHRTVVDFYRSQIPNGRNYYLAPFSIKKNSNIYGIIFGTNHTLGIEKFLKIAWKLDPIFGEANFDIDNEKIDLAAPSLFPELNVPKKVQVFENDLEQLIRTKKIKSNKEAYEYGLLKGFQPKTVTNVLKNMISKNKIQKGLKTQNQNIHKLESELITLRK